MSFGGTKAKNVFILWAIVAVATARDSLIFESFLKIDYGKRRILPSGHCIHNLYSHKLVEELEGHISEELGPML